MKLNHVLVVFKRDFAKPFDATNPQSEALQKRIEDAQKQHQETISRVGESLNTLGIPFREIDRNELRPGATGDLMITLGGDGTVLAAAHAAGNIPLFGVNSMPGHSVGFFCTATADNVFEKLKGVIEDKSKQTNLPLIESFIDAKPVPVLALNEILFAGSSPAETVRYAISSGGKYESQKSSGVWIAAGPGSTAALHSAGGKRLKIDSERLQFLVREPCKMPGNGYKLLKGVLPEGAKISIISEMGDGKIFIDGPKISYPVPTGSEVIVKVSAQKLRIFL